MEAVLRALVVYVLLVAVFRLAGRRTLAQMTNFDFVLLLIVSEATQNAMIGNDYSITNGFLVVLTLIGIDIFLSLLKQRSESLQRWLDGLPMVLVENGQALKDRMTRARVDENDVLSAARELQGLERMDQIKYAVLEVSGGISIIPRTESKA
ncbi:MAG: DUF421 domain-containing protein [Nitrospiraceae bacterium]|jgi:uncharacterized membrane protein YcaP (DUF421 family)|nr:DUF421 domain-containing protein [Nitrospiraceae bacterium]